MTKRHKARIVCRVAGASVALTGLSVLAGGCLAATAESEQAEPEQAEDLGVVEEGVTQFLTGTAWACERSIALGNAWGSLQQKCLSSCNTYCPAGPGAQESCTYDNWESGRHYCPSTGILWYCSVFTTCQSPPPPSPSGGGSGGPSGGGGGCDNDWGCPTSMECCWGTCTYLGCC